MAYYLAHDQPTLLREIEQCVGGDASLDEAAYHFLFCPWAETADKEPRLKRYLSDRLSVFRRTEHEGSDPTMAEELGFLFSVADNMARVSEDLQATYPEVASQNYHQLELWLEVIVELCEQKRSAEETRLRGLGSLIPSVGVVINDVYEGSF